MLEGRGDSACVVAGREAGSRGNPITPLALGYDQYVTVSVSLSLPDSCYTTLA